MNPASSNKRTHSEYYRECQRNHAAALGAHAIDGCGEFIAAPTSDPADPTSLTCVACGCHRNFHRKEEVEDGEEGEEDQEEEEGSHVLLTLKTGGMGPACCGNLRRGRGSKRFRSRFSREQKEGMMELAERLGWRLQRRDEGSVEQGCSKIGVERGVFKVWMHNNKLAALEMKRRSETMMAVKSENKGDEVNGENGLNYSSPSPSPN